MGNNGSQLYNAAKDGQTESVRTLLEGADSRDIINWRNSAYGWTPLNAAVHHGKLDVAKLLIGARCNVDLANNAGGM